MQKNLLILLLFIALGLSACGIKPKTLSAPDAAKTDQFPQTYPSTH